MPQNSKLRNTSMDIIRSVAVFSVICVHFFLNSGFYSHVVAGKSMFVMTVMRTAFMVSVPLFMLLTGYLMNKKVVSKNYYFGLSRIIIIYLLATIVCLVYRVRYLKFPFTFKAFILNILNFNGDSYAWYVEMYIGLFLIIPFLNLIYNGLKLKNQKSILIVTFIFLTALPTLLNIYNLTLEGWWQNPTISNSYNKIVPGWWTSIYPITYYFIGCYLKEYDLQIKKGFNLLLFGSLVILFGSFNYYRSYGKTFIIDSYNNWGGFECLVLSILLFVFLSHLKTDNMPNVLKWIFCKISKLSYGTYLISYIFDLYFYAKLNALVPSITSRLLYFFVMVPLVFICSVLFSYILNVMYDVIIRFYHKTAIAIKKYYGNED